MKVGVGVRQRQHDIFNVSNISTSTHVIGQIAHCVLDIVHSNKFAKDTVSSLGNKLIQPNHANPCS